MANALTTKTLELIDKLPFSRKFKLGLVLMGIPIGYVVKKHVDWKKTVDAKRRMLVHHLVFWVSCLPALKCLHSSWGFFDKNLKLKAGKSIADLSWRLAAAPTLLVAGFAGGDKLARLLFPKPPKLPVALPTQPMPIIPPVTDPVPIITVNRVIQPDVVHSYLNAPSYYNSGYHSGIVFPR